MHINHICVYRNECPETDILHCTFSDLPPGFRPWIWCHGPDECPSHSLDLSTIGFFCGETVRLLFGCETAVASNVDPWGKLPLLLLISMKLQYSSTWHRCQVVKMVGNMNISATYSAPTSFYRLV